MSEPIIKVQGLGKRYIISHEVAERYTALRDVIVRRTKRLMKGNDQQGAKEEFWALKDVSFEIKPGEAVGVIGRNGAGKSTLLKILSRITEPTNGRIEINGRIASLLEVGTGFHPELTGRENIFLNGAILGMSRTEIKRKFDEIVDFSGVEKFLDTPVKRYSSGMFVRLAFAVAAHLEPEILVVDEVLAVGDAEFQKKCLGKMDEVARNQGRTVLFVSHNLAAIQQLCSHSIWLQNGTLKEISQTATVIEKYLQIQKGGKDFTRAEDKEIYVSGFKVYGKDNGIVLPGSPCVFEISITAQKDYSALHFGIGINDRLGTRIFTLFTRYNGESVDIRKGVNKVFCEIGPLPLKPDLYDVHIYAGNEFEAYDYVGGGVEFEVQPSPFFEHLMPDSSQGSVMLKQKWSGNS